MAARKKQAALGGDWRMSPKQAVFVAEYLKDLNQTQAAIRAGYSAKTAEKNAHRLMEIEGIKQAIAEGKAKQLQRIEVSADRWVQEVAALAFGNKQDLLDEHGNWIPVHLLPRHVAATIGSLETVLKNAAAGDGVIDRVLKLRLHDKNRALDMLGKHLGTMVERVEVSGELQHVEMRLNLARKRLAEKKGGKS